MIGSASRKLCSIFHLVRSIYACADGALTTLNRFTKDGNVYATKAYCVDTAMWEIGGVVVALRLIQLAKVMLGSYFCIGQSL